MSKSRTDLDFPDTSFRDSARLTADTVAAMRAAKGDRRVAAQKLGVTLHTLASRLSIIRAARNALEGAK